MKCAVRYLFLLIFLPISLHNQAFEEVSLEVGINQLIYDGRMMSGGVCVFDYNNDGYDDIFTIGGLQNGVAFYRNNKDGTFSNVTALVGLANIIPLTTRTVGCAAADLNNNGYLDLIVTTDEQSRAYLFRNNGNGTFTDITLDAGLLTVKWGSTVSFGDYNLNGNLDIYIANYVGQNPIYCDSNTFYINLGGHKFVERAAEYGLHDEGCGLASSFTDYDNDGDLDILIANDFGMNTGPNKLFRNNYPEDSFTDYSDISGYNAQMWGMGVEGGDFDDDGDLDYYVTNIGTSRFYVNKGDGTFDEKAIEYGIDNTNVPHSQDSLSVGWGMAWFDYNNDTHLDLFVSNGYIYPAPGTVTSFYNPNRLYKNNGDGTFTEVGLEEGIAHGSMGRGIGLIDYDNDGDMDIVQAVVSTGDGLPSESDDDRYLLFRNNSSENGNNWLRIDVEGTMTSKDAFGTKLYAHLPEKTMTREIIGGGSSYMSQHTKTVHFGLGPHTRLPRLTVVFPGLDTLVLENIDANQRIKVIQNYRQDLNMDMCIGERYKNKFTVRKDTAVVEIYKARNGADSIVTTYIEALRGDTSQVELELCFGKEFGGKRWVSEGLYTDIKKNSKGCDSITHYDITVAPAPSDEEDKNLCYGGFFRERRYFNPTQVRDTLRTENGCDSIFVTNIIIEDGPKFEENYEICYGDLFEGVRVYTDTVFAENFPTTQGCDSVYSKIVNILPRGIKDSTINIYDDEEFMGQIFKSDTVIYQSLGIQAINGCDSVIAYNINVSISSIREIDNTLAGFFVNPNPTSGQSKISFNIDKASHVKIELYSILGDKISTIENNYYYEGKHQLDLDYSKYNISKGVYLLRLTTDSYSTNLKLIIN